MKPLFLSPFALVFVGCAAPAPPPRATPPDAPPAATNAKAPRCEGRSLTLEEIWNEACRTATKPEATDEQPAIALELSPNASYVSGQAVTLGVAFVNRSDRDAVLVFHDHCLGLEPSQRFNLVAENASGHGAALEQTRPPISRPDAPCKLSYVRATLPPGGKISTSIRFEVAAETPIGPEPSGPLAPGTYSVEVTGPLVRQPPLTATFPLVVAPK